MHRLTGTLPALVLLAACSGPSDVPSGQSGTQVMGEAYDASDPAPPGSDEARKLLKAYFAKHPACTPFFKMPWDVAVDSPEMRQRAQAFVDAGLLRLAGRSSFPGAVGPRPALRYVPTAEGDRYFGAHAPEKGGGKDALCYGTVTPTQVAVENADPMMRRAQIAYRFRLTDIPAWTRSPGITALYPWLQKALTEERNDRVDLVFRDGAWRLDDTPTPLSLDLQQLSH